jgi:hypothetical protein
LTDGEDEDEDEDTVTAAASTVDIFYVWPIAETLSMLHDLPPEVLDIVLRQVGARSLCRLACVSKGMLRAVGGAPLRVTLRPGQGSVARRWLLDPKVQRRVVVLCVRRGSLPHSFVYPTLKNLRVLDVAFSFVPPRLLDAFARVTTLRTLRIHRLGTMGSGVFSTRAFEALVALEELALTESLTQNLLAEPAGRLRIAAPLSFGHHRLVPLLPGRQPRACG